MRNSLPCQPYVHRINPLELTIQYLYNSRTNQVDIIIYDSMVGSSGPVPVPEVYTETTDPEIVLYQKHQKTAARLSAAEEAKKLVGLARLVIPVVPVYGIQDES